MQHTEAIEQALCFGWIDSIGRRIDDDRYQVRFTPRRKGSVWSAINIAKIAELTGRGLMHPAGLQAFELRKPERVGGLLVRAARRRGARRPADGPVPGRAQVAWQWFSAQPASYRRAAVHWVVSAKRAETRRAAARPADHRLGGGPDRPPLTRR